MPQGPQQPSGFIPFVRPPAHIPTQTRPPAQTMHGVNPLYPHHTGLGSNTQQGFSGIIQSGHIGARHLGLNNVRLPLSQQQPGLHHIQSVQPHIQPLLTQRITEQCTTQPGYVRGSQPNHSNVRLPTNQQPDTQRPSVQNAHMGEVLPKLQ